MALALLVVIGWLICVCLHEFGHALVAYLGGDESVKTRGYLSLNIVRYIDPGLSLILPAIVMAMGGIGLPGAAVYINESKLRNRFWRSATSAAGPFSTMLVTSAIAWLATQESIALESWVRQGLAVIVLFNVASTFLNLAPLPPLDGYGVVEPWLPLSIQQRVRRISPALAFVVILSLFSLVPFTSDGLWSSTFLVIDLMGVPHSLILGGYDQFHKFGMWVVIALLVVISVLNRRNARDAGAAAAAQSSSSDDPEAACGQSEG